MSLEEALNKNTAAMERHNALLEKVLDAAGAKGGTKPAAKDDSDDDGAGKKKPGRPRKKDDDGAIDYDTLKAKLAKWLGEFKANEKDPETAERKKLVQKAFKAIEIEKLDEIQDDPEKLARVNTWFEEKAKPKGRLTPEPSEDDGDEGGDGDDMDI